MANGNKNKNQRALWNVVNDMRQDLAEVKTMLKMHIGEGNIHHAPPCKAMVGMQNMMFSAAGAAILALLSAVGSLILNFMR